eukprot:14136391-Alexandrium_andersonii.AAC.1
MCALAPSRLRHRWRTSRSASSGTGQWLLWGSTVGELWNRAVAAVGKHFPGIEQQRNADRPRTADM